MKKIVSLVLLLVMLVSALSVVSCSSATVEAKLGLGFATEVGQVDPSVKDNKDVAGAVNNAVTVAATLFDANGKLISVDIDVLDASVSVAKDGTFTVPAEFKTKRELGDAYGMKAYAQATYEWYEQADSFEKIAKGKTIDQIKALVTSEGKGNQGVIAGGCTIVISDFVKAIEASVNNQKDVTVASDATVSVSVSATATGANATATDNGSVTIKHTFSANVAERSVTGNTEASFAFTAEGKKPAAN